jgi:exoribonuclease-2
LNDVHGPPPAALLELARRALAERGLEPDFSPQVWEELSTFTGPARADDDSIVDLRNLPWCSIDNDDSRDLDQLTVAQPQEGDAVKILVAVADVDALVKKGSAIDHHA